MWLVDVPVAYEIHGTNIHNLVNPLIIEVFFIIL